MKKLFLLLMFIPYYSFAATYYVERIESKISEDIDTTITELIGVTINETGSHTTVSNSSEADFILKPKLLKLGNAYIITLDKIKNGKIVFSSKLKAESIETIDSIVSQLVLAVIKENAPLNEQQSKERQQKKRQSGTSVSIGPALFSNLNTDSVAVNVSPALYWDVDIALIKLLADISTYHGSSLINFGIGGQYFILEKNISPFIGGDFGYGFAKMRNALSSEDDSARGFAVGGVAGVQFLRFKFVNLELSFRIASVLDKVERGYPVVYALRLGVNF